MFENRVTQPHFINNLIAVAILKAMPVFGKNYIQKDLIKLEKFTGFNLGAIKLVLVTHNTYLTYLCCNKSFLTSIFFVALRIYQSVMK